LAWLDQYNGPVRAERRDFIATTPQQMPSFAFHHSTGQEVLLKAAGDAGAEICRGSRVCHVKPGSAPSVTVERDGRVDEFRARLVVGADGRASMVRHWVGFPVHHDAEQVQVAGVLLEGMGALEEDVFCIVSTPGVGAVVLAPQGQGRVRAYLAWPTEAKLRLQGAKDLPRFIAESVKWGAAPEWYAGTRPQGPLATFDGADTWVGHPYKEGVALIGDAAATNNPTWGQGLSLAAHDVRVLRDALLNCEDWNSAGHVYAAEHDRCYKVIHTVTGWWTELFYGQGPIADARRSRVLPLLAQDRSRVPDHIYSGPELAADETARRRFFGED
jgi:2-polyprenyl-6-methoxyphenol hydroxylase-like FAD-dependent oxidoreductase